MMCSTMRFVNAEIVRKGFTSSVSEEAAAANDQALVAWFVESVTPKALTHSHPAHSALGIAHLCRSHPSESIRERVVEAESSGGLRYL
jgi:hypothetical protein